MRGPEAWDGLVELFRRPVFLAFDLLLVAGLAWQLVVTTRAVRPVGMKAADDR